MAMTVDDPSGAHRVEPWARAPLVGSGLWGAWVLVVRPEWTAVLLLLSPFVLLPLGLRLAANADTGPDAPAVRRLSNLAPLLAVTAAASFLPDPGILAAVLAAPWLGFTLVVAMAGAARLLSRHSLADPGIGADAGLVFVAVGGAWLVISRAGLHPLGFDDAIVQLTAVHFHHAGFALPIVSGVVTSRLDQPVLFPLAVIVGVPLTAAGITAGGWLEWVAATAMALAGIGTALQLLQLGARVEHRARWLIAPAGLALLTGMGLALGWAWSAALGWTFVGLDTMAATHGSLNALGFGLLGLVGLNVLPLSPRETTVETSLHLGSPTAATVHRIAARAARHRTTNPTGLLDRPTPAGFTRARVHRRVEHGDFVAAATAIRDWRGHREAGITLSPSQPDIAVGETLVLVSPVGPLSVSAACRIVQVVDEPDRYGFTYATLPHHVEDGEQSFVVSRHEDGSVHVEVTAVSRPATVASRVCPPLSRYLQDRAANRYLAGIAGSSAQVVSGLGAR